MNLSFGMCRRLRPLLLMVVIICNAVGPNLVDALFEDQAFKFDWREQYIGKSEKLIAWHDASSTRSDLILTATKSNVLAGIFADNGRLKWRHQILADGKRIYDLTMTSTGKAATVTVSDDGEALIHFWNPSNGILVDEIALVARVDIENIQTIFIHGQDVYTVESFGKGVKVQCYDLKTGKEARSVISYDDVYNCQHTESMFVCLSSDSRKVRYTPLPLEVISDMSSSPLESIPESSMIETFSSVDNLDAVKVAYTRGETSDLLLIRFSEGQITDVKTYESSSKPNKYVFISGCSGKKNSKSSVLQIEQIWDESDQVSIEIKSEDDQNNIHLGTDRGNIESSLVLCSKSGGTPGQVYLTFSDGSLLALSYAKSSTKWIKDEGLAELVAVELVDSANKLNLNDDDEIDADLPPVGEKNDLIEQFVRRIKRHANQIHSLLRQLVQVKDIASFFIDQSGSRSDEFGMRKVIVAVTKHDKIYGIDSKTGKILWQFMVTGGIELENEDNPVYLFLQRPANYYHLDAKCAVVYTNRKTKVVELTSFNPINGKVEATDKRSFGKGSIVKAFLLHHSTEDNIRPLVVLNRNNQVMIEPESSLGEIKSLSGKIYIASKSKDSDKITGQRLLVTKDDQIKLTTIWTLTSPGTKIMHLVSKPTDQTVHSQGRVMADRSVLFKYINPNLAFALAEGKDASSKPFINIYLLDLVTGRVVFSVTHKRVNGPYHIVHSENWAVYTYYNEKSRRAELSSLELFEGKTQGNATTFSSLTDNISPLVERQSYILDPSFVNALADTKTLKAITTKHILMATSTGAVYDIPKHFLDPRRPNMNTPPDQREPGLPAYMPELKLPPESILNYNQSVTAAKGIITAPTGLESTSVVFVHGLDMYCTTVTPSKAFDLLKDDFDYYVIASVLTGLVVASYLTRKLSQNKALKQAWR